MMVIGKAETPVLRRTNLAASEKIGNTAKEEPKLTVAVNLVASH
ncbi:hypothetical protein [Lederbergia galactosidilytica]|nr:hypothetical protein [Lederbergia galactosidilytica]